MLDTKNARVHLSDDVMQGGKDDVVPVNLHHIIGNVKGLEK